MAGFDGPESVDTSVVMAGFGTPSPGRPRPAHGNARGAQIAAGGLTAHTGRRLDPPKRPPQATEGEDLLLFLVVQDVAHPSEGP